MNQKHYKVSVITPFHNVDLNMFKNCRESMLKQTIGFENIQWIIVLHNCEDLYLETVPQYFEGLDNVIVKVLNNDSHTPSSPRNHALPLASGDYIGFLDGDDSYTPWCLEKAVREIEDAGAQVLCFRREYQLERPWLFALTEKIMWNQTYERIIVEKAAGTWRRCSTVYSDWALPRFMTDSFLRTGRFNSTNPSPLPKICSLFSTHT